MKINKLPGSGGAPMELIKRRRCTKRKWKWLILPLYTTKLIEKVASDPGISVIVSISRLQSTVLKDEIEEEKQCDIKLRKSFNENM